MYLLASRSSLKSSSVTLTTAFARSLPFDPLLKPISSTPTTPEHRPLSTLSRFHALTESLTDGVTDGPSRGLFTKVETGDMARVSASKRKREARKARTPGNHHTAAPKANSHENHLLREDQKRAFSERGLLEDTKFQTDEITAPRQRELFYIFRHKVELPRSLYGRDRDNQLRRDAVVEIMHVRVRAGIDPPTEPLLWAGKGVDITNGLRRKLAGYFGMAMLPSKPMICSISVLILPM